jgi:predicted RNase H-like nuclease (RuvC/YqgF family)
MATVYEIMKAKLRGAVKSYNKIKADLDEAEARDEATDDMYDKERLYRGIVRGQSMMFLAYSNPQFHKDTEQIKYIEEKFGMPVQGESRRPPVSPRFIDSDA